MSSTTLADRSPEDASARGEIRNIPDVASDPIIPVDTHFR